MEDLSSAQAKVRRELWRLKRAEAREEQKVANPRWPSHRLSVMKQDRDARRRLRNSNLPDIRLKRRFCRNDRRNR
jgi:hypothetical protein